MFHPPPPSRIPRAWLPLWLFVVCTLAQGACSSNSLPLSTTGLSPCLSLKPAGPGNPPGVGTVSAGTLAGSFSVTSSGEVTYSISLAAVPGRAGVEPRLAVTYDGSGDGVLGAGFSLGGLSAITRCPQNLAQDGEIREVKYDAQDKLCLDGKRLVVVNQGSSTIEYRTFPDTNVKVLGHQPTSDGNPADALYFEAFTPSGLVIEYGSSDTGKPAALAGAAQAWLLSKAHDGRGNAMTYTYCLTDGGGYTSEVALAEIDYTSFPSFQGSPALAASRAVTFIYGTKAQADIRSRYSGGMALQNSLVLNEIDMLGPGAALVRRYSFSYGLGPTTHRTLLQEMKECGSDGVCKPPTQFKYSSSPAGLQKHATSIPAPTSTLASPMLLDIDGDGLDDSVLPDTVPGLSTPGNPITNWTVARNHGPSASPPYLSTTALAGTLVYGDPLHPHAVTGAGTDTFGYDAVGNQIARPGGATVSYTPFDLPKTITQSTGAVTFAYDGDEKRVRKTTPSEETIYFAELFEQVTTTSSPTAYRYYVHSPERVAAIVTVGGTAPGTVYVHVDHLGSVDVLTDGSGNVVERRSYDPFGQRRNSVWGQPVPASFPNLTTVGYTGQEADSELGLVNMRGRIYDPKVGRFLTTDPIVSDPLSGQSWNPYSYVVNNPLNFVDPSGFGPGDVQGEDGVIYAKLPDLRVGPGPGMQMNRATTGVTPPPKETGGPTGPPPPHRVEGSQEAVQNGAAARPVDVSTTGSGAGQAPQSLAAVAKGIGLGIWRFYTPDPVASVKTATGITLADNTVKGARDDGALGAAAGAVNTVNPLFHWGVGVVDAQQKANSGDTAGAVATGTGVVLGVATTVLGGVLGAAGERGATGPSRATIINGTGVLDTLRGELGLSPGEGTLARLDVGGQTFYGINGHGQQFARPSGVNFQSLRHAEGDVFGQAARAGISGGNAILYVDRSICVFCQSSLQVYIRALGLDSLTIVEPGAEPYPVAPR